MRITSVVPVMTLSSVDLPEPLTPSTPILAPRMKDRRTSLSSVRPPGMVCRRQTEKGRRDLTLKILTDEEILQANM
jgi:hypothetical protein